MAGSVSSFFGFGDEENTPGATSKVNSESKSIAAIKNSGSSSQSLLKNMNSNKQVTNQIQVAPIIKVDVKDGRLPEDMGNQIQTLITQAVNNASNNIDNSTSLNDGEY
jgi:predicted oxidoreductase